MAYFTIPKDMDVPKIRRKLSLENGLWLLRNLGIRNSEHPEFQNTLQGIQNIVKDMPNWLPTNKAL